MKRRISVFGEWVRVLGLAGAATVAVACGGSVGEDGSGNGSGGSGASSSGSGGSGATGGGQGASGGSGGSGGSSTGSGGSGGGSGGTGQGGQGGAAYDDCVTTCTLLFEDPCPNEDGSRAECIEETCSRLPSKPKACESAFAAAFRCFIEAEPLRCDEGGSVVIECGPCDDELKAVADTCNEDEIRCVF